MAPLVFLSSTRQGLTDHRVAVQNAVLRLDVLYRGMEHFGSRSQPPRRVMLDELLKCDLYIGIIGLRYGSIDVKTGLSYTELEYHTARKSAMQPMLFLMDEKHPVADEDKEPEGNGRAKLARFRRQLCEDHVPEWFTTPDDLAAKVAQSLERWIAPRQIEWERLRHRPVSDFENGYIRKLYSHRELEVKEAIEHLSTSNNRTALEHLYAVLHRADLPQESFHSVLYCLVHSPDERRVAQKLVNLVEDVPDRRGLAISAMGNRSLLQERSITREEIRCVLSSEGDLNPEVRYQVEHALGKFLLRATFLRRECVEALARLTRDPDEYVRRKAQEALHRIQTVDRPIP
jgi:hypothetical protein